MKRLVLDFAGPQRRFSIVYFLSFNCGVYIVQVGVKFHLNTREDRSLPPFQLNTSREAFSPDPVNCDWVKGPVDV